MVGINGRNGNDGQEQRRGRLKGTVGKESTLGRQAVGAGRSLGHEPCRRRVEEGQSRGMGGNAGSVWSEEKRKGRCGCRALTL